MKLMVLDGNSLVNRAFFGIKLLTTKDGRYTNAIYGFQNILLNLLAAHKPDAVAIAWDERAPTFRHTAYDGYKATRHGMPEELAQQMPVLKELLTDLGFVQVSKAGWEADDILGTLAAACEAAGGTTLLATGDRDSLQLVDDATTVLLATNKETIPMDPAAIREKYGIEPPQLIDVKSLMGDASDNIPGVPGIGEKTALALISKFGSLQGVYDNIDDKAVKPGQRAKLTANRDKADLSYMLGTIRKDAPIETDPAAYLRQPGDPAAAAQLLAALEMHKLVDRWGLNGGTAPAPSENAAPLETVEPSPLPLLPEGRFYAARNADGNWFLVQGQDVYLPDTDRLAAILDSGAELWAFDAKPLYRLALEHGGIGSALRFDGKLAAYLLNPSASGYEVHSLAAEYGVHAAFACEAAPDAGVLAGLCDTLAAALDESGQRKLLDEMELPLARVLADMERIGFAIDADGIRAFGDSLRSELDGILNNIYTTVGYSFNVNSPKQLGEALFDKLGLPPRKKNARGYSTDAETLESLRPYSPVIDEILKYRAHLLHRAEPAEHSHPHRAGQPPARLLCGGRGRDARGRRLLADRAAHSGAHHRRRAHAAGVFERRGHPPLHRRQNLPHPRERGHAAAAFGQQGHQLRHHVRQGRVLPEQGSGHPGQGGGHFLKDLPRHLPEGGRVYEGLHRPREGQGLRRDAVWPPPRPAGAGQLELSGARQRRADGPQHADPGHCGGHH